jgi:hypothetical protein
MEPAMAQPAQSDLNSFIDFLYDGLDGYAYLAAKDPNSNDIDWLQEFFKFPEDRNKLETTIQAVSKTHEIYLSPVVYTGKRAIRENVKESNVVWTEFDGNATEEWKDIPGPSLIIQSSTEDHQHVYWKLDTPLQGPDAIEHITKRITYNYKADNSAWDATQVLRPPGTFNHKRGLNVTLKSRISVKYDSEIFNSLPEPPPDSQIIEWEVSSLPDAQDVVLRHTFPEDAVQLLKRDVQVGERSTAYMHLAYSLASGTAMTDVEMFVILKMADDMWGKFKKRRDRNARLSQIVSIARQKYPAPSELVTLGTDGNTALEDVANENDFHKSFALDYMTFLSIEVEFDWVVEGMLMDQGNMLMAGESGVGKTQVSLEFMKHIALGKDYLHYKIEEAKRIVFMSLEMGLPDLQFFMRKQDKILNDEERELLKQNLIIIPHGEAWPLNTKPGQDQLDRVLDHFRPEGLFVDSVGSAVIGDLNKQAVVQDFVNYNDRIRKNYGLFLWYIHHTRKPAPGQKGTNQSDIYGDQYLVNRATSSYILKRGKDKTIRIQNVKNRLAAEEADYYIKRDGETLTFTQVDKDVQATLNQFSEDSNDDDGDSTTSATDTAPGGFQL